MTEAEWLMCTDPRQMLQRIGQRDSVRQARCILRELMLPLMLTDCSEEGVKWVRMELDRWVDDQEAGSTGAQPFPQVLSDRIGMTWPTPDGCRAPDEPVIPTAVSLGGGFGT